MKRNKRKTPTTAGVLITNQKLNQPNLNHYVEPLIIYRANFKRNSH